MAVRAKVGHLISDFGQKHHSRFQMNADFSNKPGNPRYCWVAIGFFILSLVSGPIVTMLQQPFSGDETVAAALQAAAISGGIFVVGLITAIFAYVREKECKVLRWVVTVSTQYHSRSQQLVWQFGFSIGVD